MIDEAYREFVTDGDVPDAIDTYADRPNVAVLRTLSKAWGLAGLRVGYLVAAPEVTILKVEPGGYWPDRARFTWGAMLGSSGKRTLTSSGVMPSAMAGRSKVGFDAMASTRPWVSSTMKSAVESKSVRVFHMCELCPTAADRTASARRPNGSAAAR